MRHARSAAEPEVRRPGGSWTGRSLPTIGGDDCGYADDGREAAHDRPRRVAAPAPQPERLGRHRKLPVVTESQMPPVTPASLPQPDHRASMPLRPIAVATAVEAEPEPDKIVECGFCHVSGLSSQMPQHRRSGPSSGATCGGPTAVRAAQHPVAGDGAKPAPILSSPLHESLPESLRQATGPADPRKWKPWPRSSSSRRAGRSRRQRRQRGRGGRDEAVTEPPAARSPTEPAPVAAEDVTEDAPEGGVQP